MRCSGSQIGVMWCCQKYQDTVGKLFMLTAGPHPASIPHTSLSSPADLLYVETRPRKPISWSSRRTVLELTLAPEAVWNSVVRASTEGRQFPSATFSSTWRSSSLSLCGRPLRGRAVVIPPRFHLRMTALTVDRGRFNRAEISRTDFLHRWQPTTVPRWKSLSSSLRPIVPQKSGACSDPSPPPLSQFYFFFYGFWQFTGHWAHHCPLQDRRHLTAVLQLRALLRYFTWVFPFSATSTSLCFGGSIELYTLNFYLR